MQSTTNNTLPNKALSQPLILASSSTYRAELLARLRLPFESIAPEIDETACPHEAPEQTALRLAQEKAAAIAKIRPGSIIIGSDQVATLEGEQIGKPGNHQFALQQLQKMRGKQVVFHTALCVFDGRSERDASAPQVQIQNIQTLVHFRDLSDAELDAYLHIEQPYDCAGSAKNEALGIAILEKIVSEDPTALTGLPLIALTGMLRKLAVAFFK
ncbi:Maf family nucleotide pyrophosphatase [Undibacterium parvum]|uniref:7-methyl-GTP pyrophosphatase n=1 Tax=Undibacterium parvum TaxID=401471 RepID=A0A3S9HNQ5_9BURK|nr:Maf family nucleotide pyrophosphatase [Undibacterium parvum]AZP13705.1 septum formation protein Maf [Undibacterium parvum]